VVGKEQLLVSLLFGYAGRGDLIVEWERRFGILDLKSGEAHPAHRLQVSAYGEAFKETMGTRRRLHRWILYLRPTGGYRLDPCEDTTHEQDFRTFTQILGAYRWIHAHQESGRNGL
jgi:hypothetical protein